MHYPNIETRDISASKVTNGNNDTVINETVALKLDDDHTVTDSHSCLDSIDLPRQIPSDHDNTPEC